MAWVTMALRQMQLTTRVSRIQYRITQLNQQQQSLHEAGSNQVRQAHMLREIYNAGVNQDNLNKGNIMLHDPNFQSKDNVGKLWDLYGLTMDKMKNTNMNKGYFDAIEEGIQDQVRRVDEELSLEKAELEIQLKSAQEELKSLKESIGEQIKADTVKLA